MSLRPLCLLPLLLPLPALASDMADGGSCRNGAFPSEQGNFAQAKVIGAQRLYLLDDMNGCPAKGEPACRHGTYVVTGDTVISGRDLGGYRCVFFPNKVGGSAGWVDRTRLQTLPTRTPALKDWAGHWRNGDDSLVIRVQGNALQVDGDAYWPSANPTLEQRPGGPNLGQVAASAVPTGATVVFREDTCEVRAQWLDDTLLVADNAECGGMNVRFNGVYRLKQR
ncbi:hypothetical protein [Stenotrophomonas sp. PD6]|uniref:hypothetical protein n=1 Tax=Stenotrophomonas sp. PD6 TaxID=3368612 RepID=UPI003B9FA92E